MWTSWKYPNTGYENTEKYCTHRTSNENTRLGNKLTAELTLSDVKDKRYCEELMLQTSNQKEVWVNSNRGTRTHDALANIHVHRGNPLRWGRLRTWQSAKLVATRLKTDNKCLPWRRDTVHPAAAERDKVQLITRKWKSWRNGLRKYEIANIYKWIMSWK